MNAGVKLRGAAPPPLLDVGARGAVRQLVGESGRIHIDRPLHFLVLQRSSNGSTGSATESLARNVAVPSSAYLVWSPADDGEALAALRAAVALMRERFGRILLISLYDQPPPEPKREDDPHLPSFTAWVGAAEDPLSKCAAEALGEAMAGIEIDLRSCAVEPRSRPYFEPGVEPLVDGDEGISHLSLGLPQIHLSPSGTVYPQLFRELAVKTGDALLRAACAFAADSQLGAPVHYRALGRSAFVAAALSADRKLDAIARSFDFLLSVSPINTDEAKAEFLACGGEKPPRFRYRPLEIDPDVAKRRLYRIDFAQLEDPLLETLFVEKRREIETQLTMLATRNTPAFRPASMLQYGAVEPGLLADARAILEHQPPPRTTSPAIGASEIAKAARSLIACYRKRDQSFGARVELREDLAAGLMVSGPTLMISTHTHMARHRLDALLAHEVSVHLVTHFNGAAQGLGIFRTGLAQYEGVQEGLGVFAEWAVGGLTPARLRLLAGRVVAVDAMLAGADFIETYRLLVDAGIRAGPAFGIAARVFRSGGFAKDAIYLRGFRTVCDLVAAGRSLEPFWLGKIAPGHVELIEELLLRGLVTGARHRPEFLDRADAQRRIAGLRQGASLATLLTVE